MSGDFYRFFALFRRGEYLECCLLHAVLSNARLAALDLVNGVSNKKRRFELERVRG